MNFSLQMENEEGEVYENTITMSGGVAELRPGEDLEEAIHRADMALKVSKNSGKDQINKFDESMLEEQREEKKD